MSRIITFYSYKGGVGRTFAIANIAVLLSKRKKRVLLIDWDLEAPGLLSYFEPYLPKQTRPRKGLIHLLHNSVENSNVGWKSFVIDAEMDTHTKISLLYSGEQDPSYVEQVRQFSWINFFEKCSGANILDRWRKEWKKEFDFVLIDSRTGITDSGGVCTVFLPDILTLVFTANEQSFEGGRKVAFGIQEARRNLAVSRPPVAILPLLGRFDGRDEVSDAEHWLGRLSRELKPFYDDWLPKQCEARQMLELTKIPYVAKFSFGEPLPVLTHGISDPDFPGFYFENATRLLVSDFRESTNILSFQDKTKLLDEYLSAVVSESGRIQVRGIYSRSGAGREAIYFPIEDIYTPLLIVQPRMKAKDPIHSRRMEERGGEWVPLTELFANNRRLLIIGEPGGGKTTFLRLIACVLAKDAIGEVSDGRKRHLGMPLDRPAPIPILIRVAALANVIQKGVGPTGVGTSWLTFIEVMEAIYGPSMSDMLQSLLTEGRCALLLDGIDEVADESIRNRIVDVVNSALVHWGNNLFVLSSRPFGYHDIANLKQMTTAHIHSFGEKEIVEFLSRWGKGLYREEEKNCEKYLSELRTAIINSPSIKKLARSPVMLTCLCVVHWNERRLPEGKADLLSAVLRWLLNTREDMRKKRGYTNSFAEECFKALALAMTVHPEGKQIVADLSWAADQIEMPFTDFLGIEGKTRIQAQSRRFLEEEMLDSGIVEKFGTGQIRFWFLHFQEHFTARALVDLSDDNWWKIIKPQLFVRQWTEVLDNLAGCLAWTGLFRLNILVEKVLGSAKKGNLASIARVVGVLGRILRILEVYDYKPPARLGWEKAREKVMDIFTLEGAARVPMEQRIAAAEALGQAGDPRIKPLEIALQEIPGMPNVFLGKYPVTVIEYLRFIENRGYEEPKYWGEWWRIKVKENWIEPTGWDEQIEHLNRPVSGVSWYEAVAYCNWLTEQTRLSFRLPKIAEWEKAAGGGEFPWGRNEPNLELLNFDNNIGHPTPVGVYPAGASPSGHLDMAGNVWEWNCDLYEKDNTLRMLSGGSWNCGARDCRSSIRIGSQPDIRNYDFGFRLSMSN